ncbi:hypothetical protein D3C73_1276840 [compost metagenome]
MVGFAFTRLLKQGARRQGTGDQVDMIAKIFQPPHFTGDDAVNDLFDDRIFIVEVAVDLTDAKLGTLRDFRHAGGVKTVLTKTEFCGVDNLIAAGLCFGLPAVAGGYHVPILCQVKCGSLSGCERSFSIVMQQWQLARAQR